MLVPLSCILALAYVHLFALKPLTYLWKCLDPLAVGYLDLADLVGSRSAA